MLAAETIQRELRRVRKALREVETSAIDADGRRRELYGAQQALAWVVEDNAMAPCKAALLGEPDILSKVGLHERTK